MDRGAGQQERARWRASIIKLLPGEPDERATEGDQMSALAFAIVAGLAFGALAVALMLPMDFPDKTTAVPGAARGAIVGLLISIPSAIVTKTYVPVLVVGAVGGAIIGLLAAKIVA
jgi:hypothetical protein